MGGFYISQDEFKVSFLNEFPSLTYLQLVFKRLTTRQLNIGPTLTSNDA